MPIRKINLVPKFIRHFIAYLKSPKDVRRCEVCYLYWRAYGMKLTYCSKCGAKRGADR